MLVEPGFFRTDLLSPQSTQYVEPSIEDYAERTTPTVEAWKGMDSKQGGDPTKLADALVELAALEEPPVRFATPLREENNPLEPGRLSYWRAGFRDLVGAGFR